MLYSTSAEGLYSRAAKPKKIVKILIKAPNLVQQLLRYGAIKITYHNYVLRK